MRNPVTFIVGLIILVIFGSISFFFQVRQNEVAFLTTFGKASDEVVKPGLRFKLPWPIQKVHRFDARLQNFEGKFEQTQSMSAGASWSRRNFTAAFPPVRRTPSATWKA